MRAMPGTLAVGSSTRRVVMQPVRSHAERDRSSSSGSGRSARDWPPGECMPKLMRPDHDPLTSSATEVRTSGRSGPG